MTLSVFISHAVGADELPIVDHLASALKGAGVEAYLALHDRSPGTPLGEKVQRQISQADLVIAFLTKKGVDSAWVNQEVGFALGRGKRVIPFVETGVDPKGMLHGVEYFPFDPTRPADQVSTMSTYLAYIDSQKTLANTQRSLVDAQADAERNGEILIAIVTIGLIILLVWALSRK